MNGIMPSPASSLDLYAHSDAKSTKAVTDLKTAREFEAFFLARTFDFMFEGVATDGPFGGGQSEAIFRSMLNDHYARTIVASGGVGIADAVHREMLKMQEVDSQ